MDLKAITKKFFTKKKKYKKDIFMVNPDIYWKSILLLSVCLILSFFAFSYYITNKVNSTTNQEEVENLVKLKTINKEKLQNLLEYFENKETYSNEIINNPSPVIDPSL